MNDAIPTTQGTRVCALVYDTGTIQVPGIVLHLTPGTHYHQLTVLVRLSTGTFRTEEYLLPPTRSTNRIRHNYLGLPGARLRQAWTDLALWDLLEIPAGLRGPQGGDAVRLTTAWHDADPGDIGVLDGFVGQPLPAKDPSRFTPALSAAGRTTAGSWSEPPAGAITRDWFAHDVRAVDSGTWNRVEVFHRPAARVES
jgi:hypothetical protein